MCIQIAYLHLEVSNLYNLHCKSDVRSCGQNMEYILTKYYHMIYALGYKSPN